MGLQRPVHVEVELIHQVLICIRMENVAVLQVGKDCVETRPWAPHRNPFRKLRAGLLMLVRKFTCGGTIKGFAGAP